MRLNLSDKANEQLQGIDPEAQERLSERAQKKAEEVAERDALRAVEKAKQEAYRKRVKGELQAAKDADKALEEAVGIHQEAEKVSHTHKNQGDRLLDRRRAAVAAAVESCRKADVALVVANRDVQVANAAGRKASLDLAQAILDQGGCADRQTDAQSQVRSTWETAEAAWDLVSTSKRKALRNRKAKKAAKSILNI